MGDDEAAIVSARRVVNIDVEVGYFASLEVVLLHGHLHDGNLATYKSDFFEDRDSLIEFWIGDHGARWAYVDALAVAHFTRSPFIIYQISANRHEVCFEKVLQLAKEVALFLDKEE